MNLNLEVTLHFYFNRTFPPDGVTTRGGLWPPLQCASKPLDSLLCLSIHTHLPQVHGHVIQPCFRFHKSQMSRTVQSATKVYWFVYNCYVGS